MDEGVLYSQIKYQETEGIKGKTMMAIVLLMF
jgi:hypothetical protein